MSFSFCLQKERRGLVRKVLRHMSDLLGTYGSWNPGSLRLAMGPTIQPSSIHRIQVVQVKRETLQDARQKDGLTFLYIPLQCAFLALTRVGERDLELYFMIATTNSTLQPSPSSPAGKCLEEGARQGFGNAFWRGGP